MLENIRNQRQPVDFGKLNDHALQHDRFIHKLQCKKADKNAASSQNMHQVPYVPKYRSKFYLRNLEQEQARKEMAEAKSELRECYRKDKGKLKEI